MGLMDELKKLTHPYSEKDRDDDYDEYEDDDEGFDEPAPTPASRRGAFSSRTPAEPVRQSGNANTRVVSINNTQLEVVLVKPERYDMVSTIADNLRQNKAVVLNLEQTNKDVARRIVDFLSGCAYAIDGKIQKVAIATYLVTPRNVGVVNSTNDTSDDEGSESSYL